MAVKILNIKIKSYLLIKLSLNCINNLQVKQMTGFIKHLQQHLDTFDFQGIVLSPVE